MSLRHADDRDGTARRRRDEAPEPVMAPGRDRDCDAKRFRA